MDRSDDEPYVAGNLPSLTVLVDKIWQAARTSPGIGEGELVELIIAHRGEMVQTREEAVREIVRAIIATGCIRLKEGA